MSAAAARRRKQLASRNSSSEEVVVDAVAQQLEALLQASPDNGNTTNNNGAGVVVLDEATAYEALQLAQSVVRRKVKEGQFAAAAHAAYACAKTLLRAGRVSIASQLLALLVSVLRETHTTPNDACIVPTTLSSSSSPTTSATWIDRLEELHALHSTAMDAMQMPHPDAAANSASSREEELLRLQRLQLDWLRACIAWSSDLGPTHMGDNRLHYLLACLSWKLSCMDNNDAGEEDGKVSTRTINNSTTSTDNEDEDVMDEDDEDWIQELQCDAIQHACLAERPDQIVAWLATLSDPTDEQVKAGHKCPPALRDGLLTRAVLALVCLENLRDANALIRAYIDSEKPIEKRSMAQLTKSYTSKDDGFAPSHATFCCMLLRTVEKDVRTGPLYSWLIRSFKREMDLMYKPNVVAAFTVKIGKMYFNIQPPPSMLNMLENMMGMMGGGGMGGMAGGMNPAMLQAAMAQMQGGMM